MITRREELVTRNDFFPKNTGEHTAVTKRLSAICVRQHKMHRRNATDNESHFLRLYKLHCSILLKKSAFKINIARKRHPSKKS